jgi:Zn-dependent protease
MWRSWKVGSAFGIGIHLHWSVLVLPVLAIAHNYWEEHNPFSILFLLPLLAGVLTCLVLHELGHALMARHFGIRTRDITLYLIGGVARLERLSDDPLEELCIALAGPAVNLVLAAGLFVVGVLLFGMGLLTGVTEESLVGSTAVGFVVFLLVSNLLLAGFNLLPAFPMDGGRVLRALLALGVGQLRATEIAAPVGIVVALLVGVFGTLFLRSPVLILLVGFVIFAGQRELAGLRYREAQRLAALEEAPAREEPLDVLPAAAEPGFSGFVWDGRTRLWVVWENGRQIGTFGARSE